MAFYEDLSSYAYFPEFAWPGTQNVGWLARGEAFPTREATEELLAALWQFCTVSVNQTRGLHDCDLCQPRNWIPSGERNGWLVLTSTDPDPARVERNGERLLLGSSEIRAFGPSGEVFAAPTLVYHYVSVHHYRPPEVFIRAVMEGPRPPAPEYFDRLGVTGADWSKTLAPDGDGHRLKLPRRAR